MFSRHTTLDARQVAKRLGVGLCVASGADRLVLRLHKRRTLVLAYHNIVPEGARPCGAWSLHLPQRAFASQLDALATTHRVIPLAQIDQEPDDERPRVIITFDDAYRGAMTVGVAELEKRNMPATVFVAPGLFGTLGWWDRLADVETGDLRREVSDAALAAGAGRAEAVAAALGEGVTSLPAWAGIASEAEVRAVASRPNITLGAHAWSHPNLAALDAAELAAEVERPLSWLRTLRQVGTPWLAYPYGLTSPTVARAAADAGYAGAFHIDGGWMPKGPIPSEARFNLPRLNVASGLSLDGFRLRIAGLLKR